MNSCINVASDADQKAKSMSSYQAAAIQNRMDCSFVECKATVKTDLERFIKQTAVDEIRVSTNIYDSADRLRS